MKHHGIKKTLLALFLIVSAICCISCTKKVTNIYLSESELELRVGNSKSLICTVLPEDASDKSVKWRSSNPNIAEVSENGVVTAIKSGSCTITATSNGISATCNVTVKLPPPNFTGAYNTCCNKSYYAKLADDGSYLEIDTNPFDFDDFTATGSFDAIELTNTFLGLPDSVFRKMLQTNSLQGVQRHETENLVVSWTYHPDNGLEVIYEAKD